MTQRETLERLFRKYGEKVTVHDCEVSAILRPLQYKSGASLNLPTEYYDNLHYLYTGPTGEKLCTGDEIYSGARNYVVKRADTALVAGEELYVWAVLKVLAADADREVYLEADGERVAVADSYTVKCVQQSRTVSAWGEQDAVSTAPGRISYELTVQNVRSQSGTDLCALSGFSLIAAGSAGRVVYSGCRWKNITAEGGAGNTPRQSMELVAAARTQEKEGESGGQ
ncbi:hypothetical protein [Caproiciproducens faecalis]|uniref:Uncharacterized protein n=1 Tax=Caproiciproducens faecalis TaxID=2820301 RepID=A0ABS7DNR1_9FIRM|nr:hypothetical protein [Caproiciproducens faecalis]MBW7572717.1 hypothetical protein [Caproiciproducens faecalis]